MDKKGELLALAERCEKASGPDRELDAAIVAAMNNAIVKPYPPTDDFGPKDRWQFWSRDGAHFLGSEGKFPVKPVTASLDAAMTLVPESALAWNCGVSTGGNSAWVFDGEDEHNAAAASVPLALVSAALRAIAAKEESGNG